VRPAVNGTEARLDAILSRLEKIADKEDMDELRDEVKGLRDDISKRKERKLEDGKQLLQEPKK